MAGTLKLGALSVDIGADTSGLKKAEQAVGASTTNIGRSLGMIDRRAQEATSRGVKPLGAAVGRVGKSFDQNRHKVQQFGFQIQDIAVQLQGGTRASTVFAQQGSQIAGIFGPGGAVIGAILAVTAAMAGPFIASIFDSEDAVEKLDEALKELDKTMREAGDGTLVFTERLEEAAKRSAAAARLELRKSITEAAAASVLALEQLGDSTEDVAQEFNRAQTDASGFGIAIRSQAEALGITAEEFNELGRARRKAVESGDISDILTFTNLLTSIADKAPNASAELVDMAVEADALGVTMLRLHNQSKLGEAGIENLDSVLTKFGENSKEARDKIEELIAALEVQRDTFGQSTGAIAAQQAALKGATPAQQERIELIHSEIDALKEKAETEKRLAAEEAARIKAAGPKIAKIEQRGEGDREGVLRRFEEEREFILEQTQITDDARTALLKKNSEDRNAELLELDRSVAQARIASMASMTNDLATILDAAGSKQSSANKNAIALSRGFAATQAAYSLAINISKASEVGFPANIPLIAGAFQQGAVIANIISDAKGGGRQFGGTVSPQLAHPINEGGTPEILNQAGKQFLLPNRKGGTVTPLEQGGGSAGGVSVTVINNGTPQEVTGSSMSGGRLTLMMDDKIKAAVDGINNSLATGRGPTANAITQGMNVERKLR